MEERMGQMYGGHWKEASCKLLFPEAGKGITGAVAVAVAVHQWVDSGTEQTTL